MDSMFDNQDAGRHEEDGIDRPPTIELVVHAVRDRMARCRALNQTEQVTLRSPDLWRIFPGEIVTVAPQRTWRYGGVPYLSGDVVAVRLDATVLNLTPLALSVEGTWDPADEFWMEDETEPLPSWAVAMINHGHRSRYEMQQVLPGFDPEDPEADPIVAASEMNELGQKERARRLLMDLLCLDLRCLDAHAHLGNLVFDRRPAEALRHYRAGVAIGDLSLGSEFEGVLPWALIDNRPFLRCLNGVGLSAWRLGHLDEAARLFKRVLWLNPGDNQGVRMNLAAVNAGHAWNDETGAAAAS